MRDRELIHVPAFRRSWWGYNTRDVNLFLRDSAAERRRLEDTLTRVDTSIAERYYGPQIASRNAARGERPARAEARTPGSAIEALERCRSQRRRRSRRIGGLVAVCASALAVLALQFTDRGETGRYGEVIASAPARPTRMRDQTATVTPPRSGASAVAAGSTSSDLRAQPVVPTGSLMLTISAVEPCWIRTTIDGTQQMERVLQPGETVMLHATDEALLKVGNAAGLLVLINNRPAKPLGRSGEVVTRLITRANYSRLLRTDS